MQIRVLALHEADRGLITPPGVCPEHRQVRPRPHPPPHPLAQANKRTKNPKSMKWFCEAFEDSTGERRGWSAWMRTGSQDKHSRGRGRLPKTLSKPHREAVRRDRPWRGGGQRRGTADGGSAGVRRKAPAVGVTGKTLRSGRFVCLSGSEREGSRGQTKVREGDQR